MSDLTDLVEAAEERNKGLFLSRLPHCDKEKLKESRVILIVCRNGWLDVANELITNYHTSHSTSSTVPHHGGGASPLQLACTSGNLELVQYIIDECSCDVHVDQITSDGLSTIHCAVMGGLHIVKYLVEHPNLKASPMLMHNLPQTILFAYYNWDNDLMKYLIVKHKCCTIIDKSTGDSVLHYACRDGYIARLQFLIEECKCDSRVLNINNHTLLYTVCSSYYPQKLLCEEMLMYLTDLDSFDIKHELIRNENGLNTVECVILARWEVAMKRLVALCDDQDDKYSIISFAYYHWDDSLMRYLISELGIVTNGITGNTLLHNACRDMCLGRIKFLVKEMSNISDCSDIVDISKNTLLHAFSGSAICTPSSAVLSYLKPMCKYSKNAFNYTPLEWAIVHQTLPIHTLASVCCLVEVYGSDELHGGRILDLAFQHWSNDIIKYLLVEIKCSPVTDMSNGDTILHMACRTGNVEQVKFLIETCHCSPNVKSKCNKSLIHAVSSDFNLLQYLCIDCDCYSDLSGHQDAGTIAMQLAIAQKEKGLPVIKHLVNKCKVESSCEIMSHAWDNWCEAVMKYLIVDAKFDLTTDAHTGYTVLHHCVCQNGMFERMKFLMETCNCTSHVETLIPALIEEIIRMDLIHRIHNLQSTDFSEYFYELYYLLVKLDAGYHTIVVNCHDIAVIVQCCYYNEINNKIQIIHLLIQNCMPHSNLLTQQEDIHVCSILRIAYKMWHKDALKCLLIDKKCKMIVGRLTGDTVLHFACLEMNRLKLEFLLEECQCDAEVSNLKGETILHTLCTPPTTPPFHDFDLWFSIVKYIIETHNFHNLALQDNFGNTVFHLIYSSTKYAKPFVFDYLLKYAYDLNLKNNDGYTVLHLLCPLASLDPLNIDLITRLIQEGKCNPLLKDPDMNSILHLLASNWSAPVYSTSFLSLIYYLLYDYLLDSTSVNNHGDTVLHVACRNFNGDIALIEQVISTGKVTMLTMNKLDETPLMLLDNRCRELEHDDAIKQVKQLFSRFGEVQLTHPIRSYVNVVLLGNPEVGKSTLCKVIERRKKYSIATQFRNVKNVELHTAGIVTKIIKDNDIGRIILHDLAGQTEYYSSHTAVLENLLQGSAAIFVAVVSLADANYIKSFHQWFNIIKNVSHNAVRQCHLIVVASHADHSVVSNVNELKQSICDLFSLNPPSGQVMQLKSHGIFKLDCRKLGGNHLTRFISTLSTACKSITANDTREMSLYCHMLYDFFQRDDCKSSYTLASLIESSEGNNGLFLPKDIKHVDKIVSQLSSTGLVVYLQSKIELDKSWVVVDKSVLLSELNGVLFAPQDFEQHVQDISSNTGVVKLSHLYSIFSKYDPELLLQFLQYMELCSVISGQLLNESQNMRSLLRDGGEQYIFVPALIKSTEKPDISQTVFKFGWCLRCTKHSFFISRFIHLVQLHLACKFSILNSTAPSKFDRLCKIWTKGLHWKNTKGVETLVEVADNNQALIVRMSCEDGAESDMYNLIHDVLAEILSCKQQVMPQVVTHDLVINNPSLQRSLDSLDNVPLYSVQLLATCFINNDQFIVDNTTGENQITISKLVAHGDKKLFFNAIFAGRNPNCLANTENIAQGNREDCQSSKQGTIKIPTSMEFFHLLRTKSMNWDDIGRELGICLNDRKCLRSSISSENLSNSNCLESILDQWVESSNPNMLWNQFKAAMKRLEYNDVLKEMERSSTESHETDFIKSTKSDSLIKVGLQTERTISTNSEGATPKDPLKSPDVIDETSTLSPIQILKSHTPEILGLVSDPHKLAIDLWSSDLLSDATKDEVETNTSLNRYRKASCVLNEITHLVSSSDSAQQIETFEKFCSVLKSEGNPGLERISIRMSTAIKTNPTST